MSLPPEPDTRRERIINFVTSKGKLLESSYDLRSYSAVEIQALLDRSPLRIEAVYGYDGKPAALHGPETALWLVLERRTD
jgi:hypothetical protein